MHGWRPCTLIVGFLLVALFGGTATSTPSTQPSASPDRTELNFGALLHGSDPVAITPPQIVFLERVGANTPPWTAQANNWIEISPTRGTTPAKLSIGIRRAAIGGIAGTQSGEIVITVGAGEASSRHRIRVAVTVLRENSQPPFGSFDAPPDGTVVRGQGLALMGWALDDIHVTDVQICRDRAPGTPQDDTCGEASKTLLGHATFAEGGRPDVEGIFSTLPLYTRSSWGYILDPRTLPQGARGTLRVYALARDAEGHATLLGARTLTVDLREESSWARTSGPLVALITICVVGGVLHLLLRVRCREDVRVPAPIQPVATDKAGVAELAVVALLVLASAAINLPAMTRGLGYDELYTASHFVVDTPLWKTATSVGVFNNHIAYSLIAGLAVRLLGPAEWVLRLPALVFGAVAVCFVWRFTRVLAGARAGLLSAALLALSPFFADWSRSARGYTGLALMALISSHSFLTVIRTGSPRAAIQHTVATVLAIYVHLYGAWVFLVQYFFFLWLALRPTRARHAAAATEVSRGSLRLLWRSFLAVACVTVLLYLPTLTQLAQLANARGRAPVRAAFPGDLFYAFAGTNSVVLGASVGLLAVIGLLCLRRRRLEASYLAALLGVPFFVMWLGARPMDLYVRFFVYWMPFFACLVAVGVIGLSRQSVASRSRWRNIGVLVPAMASWLVVGLLATDWLRRDLRPAAEAGYREALQLMHGPLGQAPQFAVGGDAEMFDYYTGRPLQVLHVVLEADRVLRELPAIRVAYHDMSWNAPQDRDIASLLARRCVAQDRPPVRIFQCGF